MANGANRLPTSYKRAAETGLWSVTGTSNPKYDMYGQFPFPFVICPTESRNLLNSARQITTTHPVSSNLSLEI